MNNICKKYNTGGTAKLMIEVKLVAPSGAENHIRSNVFNIVHLCSDTCLVSVCMFYYLLKCSQGLKLTSFKHIESYLTSL